MSLTTHPDFMMSVTVAKAIALSTSKPELTPNLMIAGLFTMLDRKMEVTEKALWSRESSLRDACARLTIPADLSIEKVSEVRLPLSNRLRQLLKDQKTTIEGFVDTLLESAIPDEEDEPLFEIIWKKSSAHSRRYGNVKLTADVLAAAALFAFRDGIFVDHPAFASQIAFATGNIESIIEMHKWKAEDFKEDNGSLVDLEPSLVEKMDESFVSRLFSIISMGATAGGRIAQQRSTAFHEAGHAVASFMLQPQVPIVQVSVISTQEFEGVMRVDTSGPYFADRNRKFFREYLQICLAGGIAEQIKFGEDFCNEGAFSDIKNASVAAWNWVAKYGLDESFGPVCLPALAEQPGFEGGYLANEAHRRVQELLKASQEETKTLLTANWRYVETLASLLMQHKTLGLRDVIEAMIDHGIVAWPGTKNVKSKSVNREVRFAQSSGVCQTMEGPVRFETGDALVMGSQSEEWPISRAKFERTYTPVSETQFGINGTYSKMPREGIAIQLSAPRSIVLKDGRGTLQGRAGDWVVDYGEGDLSLVSSNLFFSYYEIVI